MRFRQWLTVPLSECERVTIDDTERDGFHNQDDEVALNLAQYEWPDCSDVVDGISVGRAEWNAPTALGAFIHYEC